MAGKVPQEDGSVVVLVETLPLGGQMFTFFWVKERIWKKKHEFLNSNTVIQNESKF